MAKHFTFKLMEIVMFVITSNPKAINRMRARKGGFFKGRVIRETSKEVWIEPINKDLLDRLKVTSFFRQAIKSGNKLITKTDLNSMGYCLTDSDDLHDMDEDRLKTFFNGGKVVDYVVIPKKQVDHWLGEKRRFQDSLDALANSPLVKKRNKKTKVKKTTNWVYKV